MGLLLSFILLLLCSSNIYAQVFINEINSFESSGDWVELYSNENVDVSGWILRDGATTKVKTIPEGSIIGPSSSNYLIIDAGSRLNVDKDIVKLFEADDVTLVDQITYGEGGNICASQIGESVGRLPDGSTSIVRFSLQTKSSVNIDQQSLCPTPTPSPTESPTPTPTATTTSSLTPTPTASLTPTKTLTPKSTKTPTLKPTSTSTTESLEEFVEGDILGIQSESESPSPTEESEESTEKSKVSIFSIVFIVLGISFVGFSGFAFFKQKRLNNNEGEKNKEII
ncbi:lamin tail domain-containing protein [Patescibacteria group bacterium]|nr:lamin tail domain-containing protein [Patescibacteria group bacterium]